jgi:sulfotransferase family protein
MGNVFFGRVNAGRGLTVFPDDVFLVSFPRSGNTWARFLIGNLIYGDDPITFVNVDSRIPDIYVLPDRSLRRIPRPRVLKSHEPFDYRYRRVIYIVRDPRDVAVSTYHYEVKRRDIPDTYHMDEFLALFLAGDDRVGSWGSWREHVVSWLATRGEGRHFLFLRYEDMLENPEHELAKVALLLNIDPTPERLARAVELSSADRMRGLEKQQFREWVETKRSRQDKLFVRDAKSGGWRVALPQASVEQIETAWGPLMETLGYELTIQQAKHSAGSETPHAELSNQQSPSGGGGSVASSVGSNRQR